MLFTSWLTNIKYLVIFVNHKSIFIGVNKMAKNTGEGFRRGAVDDRSQTYNPRTDQWVKRDADTGRFMDVKEDGTPFKGVRKED
jgi:hypothetical protein